MAESRFFKVSFEFTRVNRFGNKTASKRFYSVWASSKREATADAQILFKGNEPSATNVKVFTE